MGIIARYYVIVRSASNNPETPRGCRGFNRDGMEKKTSAALKCEPWRVGWPVPWKVARKLTKSYPLPISPNQKCMPRDISSFALNFGIVSFA